MLRQLSWYLLRRLFRWHIHFNFPGICLIKIIFIRMLVESCSQVFYFQWTSKLLSDYWIGLEMAFLFLFFLNGRLFPMAYLRCRFRPIWNKLMFLGCRWYLFALFWCYRCWSLFLLCSQSWSRSFAFMLPRRVIIYIIRAEFFNLLCWC